MQLTLTSEEATVLAELLTSQLAALRVEIGRSDHREYRDMLRRRSEVMEHIAALLEAGGATVS